ncbi:helix-turn-helix transcriptional regulator [Polaromonas sp.]|uniref:helix-turn-helix transcriptional regulator n=1 Tax=Polaromonas sp. TaxID=1869339 RepID=UPI003750C6CA
MQTNQNAGPQTERLLRLPEVESIVGLKKTSIYEREKNGTFPSRVRLSCRTVGWSSSAINAWVNERINAGGK